MVNVQNAKNNLLMFLGIMLPCSAQAGWCWIEKKPGNKRKRPPRRCSPTTLIPCRNLPKCPIRTARYPLIPSCTLSCVRSSFMNHDFLLFRDDAPPQPPPLHHPRYLTSLLLAEAAARQSPQRSSAMGRWLLRSDPRKDSAARTDLGHR